MSDNKNKVPAEAAIWLSRIERGLQPTDIAGLREWLANAAHREEIINAAKLYHGPDVVAVLSEMVPVGFGGAKPPKYRRPRTAALLIGAGLFVFTGILFSLPHFFLKHRVPFVPRDEAIYDTADGETRPIVLSDGSRLVMHGQAELYVLSAGATRESTLVRGETLFDVVSGARPFKVFAGGRHLEAPAARFDLRVRSPQSVEITVLEGAVTVKGLPFRRPQSPAEARDLDSSIFDDANIGPLETVVVDNGPLVRHPITASATQSQIRWDPPVPVYITP